VVATEVFFDFGGTLVASVPYPTPVLLSVLRREGVEVDAAAWKAADDRVLPRLQPQLYASLGQRPSYWDRVHAEVLRELGISDPAGTLQRTLHEAVTSPELHRPYPDAVAVLDELDRSGTPFHLISNNTDYLLETLDRLGWARRFRTVTYSQEAGAEKPDRRVFELALRRAGVAPSSALYVGDSWEADYLGATRAGMAALWVDRTPPTPRSHPHRIDDLRAVLAYLGERR